MNRMAVLEPEQQGPTIKAAFDTSRQAGNPSQSAAKTFFLPLAGVPPLPSTPPSLAPPRHGLPHQEGAPHRLLGLPLTPDLARSHICSLWLGRGAIQHAAQTWHSLRPTCGQGARRHPVPRVQGRNH